MTKWLEISDIFTPIGLEQLETNQILVFKNDEGQTNLKIMRISKGKVYAKEVHLYTPEELSALSKEELAEKGVEIGSNNDQS